MKVWRGGLDEESYYFCATRVWKEGGQEIYLYYYSKSLRESWIERGIL
jgi:hypothetical protein